MEKVKNPPTMQWEMTAECNHDCTHCYNYWRKDFENDREQIQKSRVGNDIEFAPFLLLWKYYAKGCKTYSQLG